MNGGFKLQVSNRSALPLLFVWGDAFAEVVPVTFFLFVKFSAFSHEPWREGGEGFGKPG